jgi:RNA polymerase sigma-70 factor (ECF subfamily)
MAGHPGATEGRQALERLCRMYWRPIYTFLRRSGIERQEARDLTQGFFVYLLEQELLRKADPGRGRFRSFLLGTLKFFVSNQQSKQRALKRGGGATFIPIETELAESNATLVSHLTPERAFDRKWALATLEEAMERLAGAYRRAGLADQFGLVQPHLSGEHVSQLAELATRLGKSEGATRLLVFRLRNRFRKLVRAVIADTVADPAQLEGELKALEAALRDS